MFDVTFGAILSGNDSALQFKALYCMHMEPSRLVVLN